MNLWGVTAWAPGKLTHSSLCEVKETLLEGRTAAITRRVTTLAVTKRPIALR